MSAIISNYDRGCIDGAIEERSRMASEIRSDEMLDKSITVWISEYAIREPRKQAQLILDAVARYIENK